MARLTSFTPDGAAVLAPGLITQKGASVGGEAVEKLARYENLQEQLCAEQEEIAQKMAKLRAEGKEKSVQFRELFGRKLTNAALIARIDALGLGR